MNKICTSVEQSKKLIELGIDRNTSDMFYYCGEDLRIGGHKAQDDDYDISAWSLTALLEMLPNDTIYRPMLYKGGHNNLWHGKNNWFDNPLDAVFEMICWLKENKNNGSDLKQNK